MQTVRRSYKAIPDKTRIEENYPKWEDISTSAKLEVFNFWFVRARKYSILPFAYQGCAYMVDLAVLGDGEYSGNS